MEEGLVSVVMPTYNTGAFLASSIDSILCQTYSNLELLITDDCSTDELTRRILSEYAKKDNRVDIVYLNGNHGSGYSRNQSISRANGQYITFCDSDDAWHPEKLERQIRFMKSKDCCLSFSSYYTCDKDDEKTGIVICPKAITFSELKHDNKIGCLTAMYDVSKHGKFYMPLIRKRQDWALFLTIMSKCKVAYGLKMPLAFYRHRDDSLSHNKLSLIKYNIDVYRFILGYSSLKAFIYFTFIFLPTYTAKIIKVRYDSHKLIKSKETRPQIVHQY